MKVDYKLFGRDTEEPCQCDSCEDMFNGSYFVELYLGSLVLKLVFCNKCYKKFKEQFTSKNRKVSK